MTSEWICKSLLTCDSVGSHECLNLFTLTSSYMDDNNDWNNQEDHKDLNKKDKILSDINGTSVSGHSKSYQNEVILSDDKTNCSYNLKDEEEKLSNIGFSQNNSSFLPLSPEAKTKAIDVELKQEKNDKCCFEKIQLSSLNNYSSNVPLIDDLRSTIGDSSLYEDSLLNDISRSQETQSKMDRNSVELDSSHLVPEGILHYQAIVENSQDYSHVELMRQTDKPFKEEDYKTPQKQTIEKSMFVNLKSQEQEKYFPSKDLNSSSSTLFVERTVEKSVLERSLLHKGESEELNEEIQHFDYRNNSKEKIEHLFNSASCSFQTASGRKVNISPDKLRKAEQLLKYSNDSSIEKLSHKRVKYSKRIEETERFTCEPERKNITFQAVEENKSNTNGMMNGKRNEDSVGLTYSSTSLFKTASGKGVNLSTEKLRQAERKLLSDDEKDLEQASKVIKNKMFCSEKYNSGTTHMKLGTNILNSEEKKITQNTSICLFQTANMKQVKLSVDKLQKAEEKFKSLEEETLKNQIKENNLMKSFTPQNDRSISSKNASISLFQTASGTDISLSLEQIQKAKQKLLLMDKHEDLTPNNYESENTAIHQITSKTYKLPEAITKYSNQLETNLTNFLSPTTSQLNNKEKDTNEISSFTPFNQQLNQNLSLCIYQGVHANEKILSLDLQNQNENTNEVKPNLLRHQSIERKKENKDASLELQKFTPKASPMTIRNHQQENRRKSFGSSYKVPRKLNNLPYHRNDSPNDAKVFKKENKENKMPSILSISASKINKLPKNSVPFKSSPQNLPNVVLHLSRHSALQLHFNKQGFPCEGIEGIYGVQEIHEEFLERLKIHQSNIKRNRKENSVSFEWTKNHFLWIVWKLASLERAFPTIYGSKYLTKQNVIQQILHRYNKEYVNGARSSIKKICNGDETSYRLLILFVSDIRMDEKRIYLSDNWYEIETEVDDSLWKHVCSKKISLGMKLVLCGVKFRGVENGVEPLECIYAQTKPSFYLHINGTKICKKWNAKLGFQKQQLMISKVSSLSPIGGIVAAIDVILQRIYPVLYWHQREDGSKYITSIEEHERENEKKTNLKHDQNKELLSNNNTQEHRTCRFLRLQILDTKEMDKSYFLTLWNPMEDLIYDIREGNRYLITNLTIKSSDDSISLSSTRSTLFIKREMSEKHKFVPLRRYLSCEEILFQCNCNQQLAKKRKGNDFDIVTYLLRIGQVHQQERFHLFLTDISNNSLMTVEVPLSYNFILGQIHDKKILSIKNLQFLYYDEHLDVIACIWTEYTILQFKDKSLLFKRLESLLLTSSAADKINKLQKRIDTILAIKTEATIRVYGSLIHIKQVNDFKNREKTFIGTIDDGHKLYLVNIPFYFKDSLKDMINAPMDVDFLLAKPQKNDIYPLVSVEYTQTVERIRKLLLNKSKKLNCNNTIRRL